MVSTENPFAEERSTDQNKAQVISELCFQQRSLLLWMMKGRPKMVPKKV